jgi:adenylosuccinate synthase
VKAIPGRAAKAHVTVPVDATREASLALVIAISGPVAVGKSVLAGELFERFRTCRVSTRQMLIDRGCKNDRGALIEAGNRLDRETDGAWVRDGVLPYFDREREKQVILIDAVRTGRQVHHLREKFGEGFIHVHVTAPFNVVKERYENRDSAADQRQTYEEVSADPTEREVWRLHRVADRLVVNHRCDPKSLLARATAGLGLFPRATERLVDVIVGGQYGSEGKGNICAHLAGEYDVLVRVGGPNAGHMVAEPPYKYVQIPSGTGSNDKAKVLIGAGATIWVPQILKEIEDHGLKRGRIVIDEKAMIIEQSDREFESQTRDSIGSTKQGVGVATARKIVGREEEQLGAVVRLAGQHPDLKEFVGSTARELEDAYASGKRIMLEGTQGTSLSLHHGPYPHVTSRETTVSGCLADAGISPSRVRRILMVTRTYPIRVGGTSGPIAIEINAKTISERSGLPLSQIEKTEVGTISGKTRRIAEFDWDQLRNSATLNGATDIALTFADYLTAENQSAMSFDKLSNETKWFIAEVEQVANAPVSLISVRFGRGGVIDRRSWQ